MTDILLYLSFCALGAYMGFRFRGIRDKLGWTSGFLTVSVSIVVFTMGLRIGSNEEVVGKLDTIGLYALIFSVVIMTMSVISLYFMRRFMGLDRYGVPRSSDSHSEAKDRNNNRMHFDPTTIIILVSVSLGILLGYISMRTWLTDIETFESRASIVIKAGLCMLLFFIGIDIGLDETVVPNFKKVGLKVLLIPLAIMIGTFAGSFICGLFLPVTMKESFAIGAGFGWYSFAPGVIMDKGYVIAGAISFMHNVMREMFGIVFIPVVAKHVGYVECVGLPGSAAMDVCVPIVERCTSGSIAIYSFVSGVVLSAAVPVLVPIILGGGM